jgi:hypothetical protein
VWNAIEQKPTVPFWYKNVGNYWRKITLENKWTSSVFSWMQSKKNDYWIFKKSNFPDEKIIWLALKNLLDVPGKKFSW